MEVKPENFLDAPVAGMSLTAEPKSRPWRRPYQFSTVDEAVAMYAPMFQDDTTVRMMLEQAENKIPLTSLADLLITANTMEGRHSLDVGLLVAPVLIEMMITLADSAGIEYVVGNEPNSDMPGTKTEIINRVMSNLQESEETADPMQQEELPMEEMVEASEEVPTEEQPRGLMARRSDM
jgi:hypothetical protein